MRFSVTTIGEGSIRMSVLEGYRFQTAQQFDVSISGAEANVIGALSRLGWSCGWVSKLPRTSLAQRILNEYRQVGIDLSALSWTDKGRLATLFVEYAVPPRATQVIFDRQNSSFSQITPDDIDWNYLLNTRMVFFTGITVALSYSTREVVAEAVKRAREKRLRIGFDVNYREMLWSPVKAKEVMLPLIQDVDLLFCSARDAKCVFNCEGSLEEMIEQLYQLSGAKHIVMSQGEKGAIGWDRESFVYEPAHKVTIIDRIGAGDALAAGVIHGYLNEDFRKGISFGVAMAALALSQYGELVMTTDEELQAVIDRSDVDIKR